MRWPWRRRDEELDEEIRAHIEMSARARVERGATEEEARAAARREFGNVGLVRETTRDVWGFGWIERIAQDVRYGLRMMRRSPGFTAVAVVTLALGIGATTAIFSVVDAVLLRSLPFHQPDKLVQLWETESAPGNYPVTGADYIDWRAQNRSFEDMAVYTFQNSFNASGTGEPERASVVETQANFFSLLGAQPILGRTFLPGEDQAGRNHVALLSYGFWQRHFGSDPNALTKTLSLDGERYDVVGVMPAWYKDPGVADVWVPIDASPTFLGPRGQHHLRVIARIKEGVTLEQARADMKIISARLEKQYPDLTENYKVSAVVVPLREQIVGNSQAQLLVMLGAVTLVLLIACANVANLLLARSAARTREIAVRAALGAGRARVIRQFLTESVVLSACGAIPGVGLAYAFVAWLRTAKDVPVSQANPIAVEPIVVLFAMAVALATGILFGLMPALQTSRVSLSETLNSGGRMAVASTKRGGMLRDALVIAEIALSLLLLAGAGLLLRTFSNLRRVDIGVRADKVLRAKVSLPSTQYATIQAQAGFYRQLVVGLSTAPGVQGAAVAGELPLQGGSNGYVTIEGRNSESTGNVLVEWNEVTPDYFRVMGIPLLAGRGMSEEDEQADEAADTKILAAYLSGASLQSSGMAFDLNAVINETMARTFWPGQDAVGKTFKTFMTTNHVVGVVGDTKPLALSAPPMPQAYFGLASALGPHAAPLNVVILGAGSPAALSAALRSAVQSLDGSLAIFDVATMQDMVSSSMISTAYQTYLLAVFAGLALLLASVGIYGVLSYVVAQRTSEIGVRMALGADRGNVVWMILRNGLALTGVGIGIGLAGAYALTGLLRAQLYGVKPTDAATFVMVSAVMAGVAVLACIIPVWRATRVDPMVALRHE